MDVRLYDEIVLENNEHALDLHTAASVGCEERVRDIIENADSKSVINQQNSSGWTPLMYAAVCANLRLVILLLEEGVITDLKNNLGNTALMLASKCGSTDIVNLLIDHKAFINDNDLQGWSALSYSTAFGHRSVVQLLIEKGAYADHVHTSDGMTPLMLAAAAGHEMIVNDLLKLELDLNLKSKNGETARSLASKNGHLKVKKMLDTVMLTKRKNQIPSIRPVENVPQSDLQKLLSEFKLSKYYPVFQSHDIDLNVFWTLSEDDLKEIGINLLGPRKKMCLIISEWYQNNLSKGSSDVVFCSKLLQEMRKLQRRKEELEVALTREVELRKESEHNLNEGIKTLKGFSDTVQRTMAYTLLLEEKLKQSHVNLKRLIGCTPDMTWSKFTADIILPLMDNMDKLLDDIHQHTFIALQQTNFRK